LEITISSRNLDPSPALVAAVEKKIGPLGRLNKWLTSAEVHFSEERNPRIVARQICEVVMEGHGQHVRCKVSAPDGFAAIDLAVVKLCQQLEKLKTRSTNRTSVRV